MHGSFVRLLVVRLDVGHDKARLQGVVRYCRTCIDLVTPLRLVHDRGYVVIRLRGARFLRHEALTTVLFITLAKQQCRRKPGDACWTAHRLLLRYRIRDHDPRSRHEYTRLMV